MEVKRELGRRWKLLDNHEKMSYVDSLVTDGLKSDDEENSGITVNDEVVSDDHYDPSPSSVSHSKEIQREAGKSGDDLKDEFCSEEN